MNGARWRCGEPAQLRAHGRGHDEERLGGEAFEISSGEDRFDAIEVGGEPRQFLFVRDEDALLQRLALDLLKLSNLVFRLAVPIHERALGHVQFAGDPLEAPALRAKFNKTILSRLIFHHFLFPVHKARLLVSRTPVRDDLIVKNYRSFEVASGRQ